MADKVKLECVDCRTIVIGDVDKAFEIMSQHTEGAHGRKPLREIEKYRNPTWGTYLDDCVLLRPEIMLAA